MGEEEFLRKTNALIRKRLGGGFKFGANDTELKTLVQVCSHLCITENAKRARPRLCFYYGLIFDGCPLDQLVPIGVAAEFIHAASLLHDDVVDDAQKRRGKVAANHLFSNAIAVLGGNYLLTQAFDLLKNYDRELVNSAIDVIAKMTKAALLEINARGRVDIIEQDWRKIAVGKTGVLFSWCGDAASLICNKSAMRTQISELGEHIGSIFQMADDLKDFCGDPSLKDQCSDIRNKEPSLPIILALKHQNIRDRFSKAFAQKRIEEKEISGLKNLVLECGAVEETRSLMRVELKHLEEKLRPFSGTLGKQYIDAWIGKLIGTKVL